MSALLCVSRWVCILMKRTAGGLDLWDLSCINDSSVCKLQRQFHVISSDDDIPVVFRRQGLLNDILRTFCRAAESGTHHQPLGHSSRAAEAHGVWPALFTSEPSFPLPTFATVSGVAVLVGVTHHGQLDLVALC